MVKKVTSKVVGTLPFVERRSRSRAINPSENKYRRLDDIGGVNTKSGYLPNWSTYTNQVGRLKASIENPSVGQMLNYWA